MAPIDHSTVRNRMLAALPHESFARLSRRLEPVAMVVPDVIFKNDANIDAVYFPESGMISMVANLDDGIQAEVGIIGNEGMLGVSLLSDTDTCFIESMVQMSGECLRIKAKEFREEMATNMPLRKLMMRYNEALSAQIMQTAACNGRHDLEQRLARWLLMAHDRTDGDRLPLTQEFIAMMLGVHRPSITVTAGILQRAGLIKYASGIITIVDRTNLEAASCECYTAVRKRFSTLLGASYG